MNGQTAKDPGKGPEGKKRKDPPATSNGSKGQGKDGKDGRAQKRAKFRDARAIRTQPSDAALKDGELDLQAFLSAREFEIKALENSMRKTKAASASRAFQKVPRAMRRRTASHNANRVPKRLRARARREQAEDNTPTVEARKRRPRTTRSRIRSETAKRLGILAEKKRKWKLKAASQKKAAATGDGSAGLEGQVVHTRPARPKIRRNRLNDPQKPKSKFRKRQIHKTWLPTHLWHAKRARMTEPKNPLWRFAIPLTPTEKCYRPTHRASGEKGAVIWDMSYMSTIGLYGSAEGIERVLKALGVTQESIWGPKGRKWRAGCKKWSGILSKERKGGRRDIGPAAIIWNPEMSFEHAAAGDPAPAKQGQRQLFIRVHPSCFLELFNELVKLVKMHTPQLYVEDLRFEIGCIELTGPGSTEALLATLHPYHRKAWAEERHATVFKSLIGVTNPASLPADSLLAFSILDPRLRYPPKQMKQETAGNGDITLLETLAKWPVGDTTKQFGLMDRNARFEAGRLPSQQSINRRKGSGLPGETMEATAADPPIPVILLASRPPAGGQVQGTWTLLAPWNCIQPIWYSLVHYPLSTGGNPRVGGLNELRQVAFEQATPWFPGDFPGTAAGAEWELEQRAKRKSEWDRRPKSKRVEWKSLDLGAARKGEVGDGFACDWEHLFGLEMDVPHATADADESRMDDTANMDIDTTEAPASSKSQEAQIGKSQETLALVNQLSKSAFTALVAPSAAGNPPPFSIISVNLTYVSKGVATTCARIYRLPNHSHLTVLPSTLAEVPSTQLPLSSSQTPLPTDIRDQWLSKLPSKSKGGNSASASRNGTGKRIPPPPRMPPGADMATRKRLVAESLLGTQLPYPRPRANQTDVGGHPLCPDEDDLIGFVTAGAFSLSEGKGTAIGSISAEKALEALTVAGNSREGRLCVVRNAGESVGWLARWELV